MLKVLVVDDEPYMLEGWRTLIDWKACGFELIGEAADGEDAWKAIEQLHPDVVITDIQMPVINGLELIGLAAERHEHPINFVIVSGYSDFQYAREAIRYQVRYYALKPIEVEEIHSMLLQIGAEAGRSRRISSVQRQERIAALAASVGGWLKTGDPVYEQEAERLLPDCPVAAYIPMLLEFADSFCSASPYQLQAFGAAAKEQLPEGLELLCFEAYGCVGLLLYSLFDPDKTVLEEVMIPFSERLLAGFSDLSAVYVGEPDCCFSNIRSHYEHLQTARCRAKLLERSGIVYCGGLKANGSGKTAVFRMADELLSCLEQGDADRVQRQADSLVRWCVRQQSPVQMMSLCGDYVYAKALSRLMEGGQQEQRLLEWARPYRSSSSGSAVRLNWTASHFVSFCAAAAARFDEQRKTVSPVAEALGYIRSHYRERLRLQRIAEQFRLHPVLLSQELKKETGCSFNRYVHRLRIEEAQRLLRRTDMKVSHIARELGYHDTDYFVEQFKEIVMCLPSEYKKTIQR